MVTPLIQTMLSSLEVYLQGAVNNFKDELSAPLFEMLNYHMGWTGDKSGKEKLGKRVRPLITLLTTSACGSDWHNALPAATAFELVHNFSLIHDDIQDNSDLRRGRETVWKRWGVAHGINAGDALFILAHLAMVQLIEKSPPEKVLKIEDALDNACLALTKGQYLDMTFENRPMVSLEEYWSMINGKTSALLSACAYSGAIIGDAGNPELEGFRNFGHYLGLAYQVQDDILGIWGDLALTGKSVDSDLLTGKKSLPVLFGLMKKGPFSERWLKGPLQKSEIEEMAGKLAREGARLYSQEIADKMTDLALESLRIAHAEGEAGEALFTIAGTLLNRQN